MKDTAHKRRILGSQDYKTLSLSALGGALEFYDFIIFAFFSVVISKLFFPPDMPLWLSQLQTFGIFAAGYLVRPFGGIVMAHFGDLIGRKKMFTLSIFLMALPTLLIGFLPTYSSFLGYGAPILLLLFRVCQGLAVGGEVPGAWTFVSEHVPKDRVGIACGILTAGLSLGIFLGSLVFLIMNSSLTTEEMNAWGWRVPFIVGGIFGFIAMYLRHFLQETPIFIEMQKRKEKETKKKLPVLTVLSQFLPQVTLSMLLTWVLSAGIMIMFIVSHTYLGEKGFGFANTNIADAKLIGTVGLMLGCIIYGLLADRFPIGKIITGGCFIATLSLIAFFSLLDNSNITSFYVLYFIAGTCVGVVGCFAVYMVRAFIAEVRYSGVSFSFNVAYAIAGGLTSIFIPFLSTVFSKYASGFYVISLFIIGILVGLYITLSNQEKKFATDI
ncbi:MAG: MFS transporter [Campylobacteraceae bacterium]